MAILELKRPDELTEARQLALFDLPGWEPGRLKEALVLVAGVGALGAEVARQLALLGIGRLLLADPGDVTHADIAASACYRVSDRQQGRAETLALRLSEFEPDLRLQTCKGGPLALGAGVLRAARVLIAADLSPKSRLVLDRWCRRTGTPWIDVSAAAFHGTLAVYDARSGACFECGLGRVQRDAIEGAVVSSALASTLAAPSSAAVLAGLAAQATLKLLCPQEVLPSPVGREYLFNGQTEAVSIRDLPKRPGCRHPEPLPVVEGKWGLGTPLYELVEAAQRLLGPTAEVRLDRPIAWHLKCWRCGAETRLFRCAYLLQEADLTCPRCGFLLSAHTIERLTAESSCLALQVGEFGLPALSEVLVRSPRGMAVLACKGDLRQALGGAA